MPLLINEDKALRTLMTGMVVSDSDTVTRPVGVWFGQPDLEIREQKYPYVTIDLIDVVEDNTRAVRGYVNLPEDYTIENYVPTEGTTPATAFPIPLALDYQVTTFSRNPRHDRQILAQVFMTRLPFKWGALYVEEDNTSRSMFLMQHIKRDTTENAKRLFVNHFAVRVFSEMFLSDVAELQKVLQVNTSLEYSSDNPAYNTEPIGTLPFLAGLDTFTIQAPPTP